MQMERENHIYSLIQSKKQQRIYFIPKTAVKNSNKLSKKTCKYKKCLVRKSDSTRISLLVG